MNEMSLWNNPDIEKTIAILDPQMRFRYQKFAQKLYSKASEEDPQVVAIEAASQIKLMLRDGLPLDDLTVDEKQLFTETFGENALNEYL
jgi:hypothetical protein